jgi:hypothetical protein
MAAAGAWSLSVCGLVQIGTVLMVNMSGQEIAHVKKPVLWP